MAQNELKRRWKEGKAAVNGWLAIPSAFVAEVMAQCGWDSVTVDLQHGVQDYLSMVACFQAMNAYPVTRLVRVPWNEPGIIGKVLDGGAYGVICPMVNTKQQCEALVSACRYPPMGTRSNGPIRAGAYGSAGEYQKTANDEVLVIPMIETREALDNLDAILDVRGIRDLCRTGRSELLARPHAEARPGGGTGVANIRAAYPRDAEAQSLRWHPLCQSCLCRTHDPVGFSPCDDR
jgi:4-hydroxy-2-oxoheptanedioate aldolase